MHLQPEAALSALLREFSDYNEGGPSILTSQKASGGVSTLFGARLSKHQRSGRRRGAQYNLEENQKRTRREFGTVNDTRLSLHSDPVLKRNPKAQKGFVRDLWTRGMLRVTQLRIRWDLFRPQIRRWPTPDFGRTSLKQSFSGTSWCTTPQLGTVWQPGGKLARTRHTAVRGGVTASGCFFRFRLHDRCERLLQDACVSWSVFLSQSCDSTSF